MRSSSPAAACRSGRGRLKNGSAASRFNEQAKPGSQSRNAFPTHGYEATREAAMAAFAKSWRRKVVVETEGRRTSILPSLNGKTARF